MEQLRTELSHLLGEKLSGWSVSVNKPLRRCGSCTMRRETRCRCWREVSVRPEKPDNWHGKPTCWQEVGLSVCRLFMV